MLSSVPYFIGYLMISYSHNLPTATSFKCILLIGRLFTGIGVGFSFSLCPVSDVATKIVIFSFFPFQSVSLYMCDCFISIYLHICFFIYVSIFTLILSSYLILHLLQIVLTVSYQFIFHNTLNLTQHRLIPYTFIQDCTNYCLICIYIVIIIIPYTLL